MNGMDHGSVMAGRGGGVDSALLAADPEDVDRADVSVH